MPPEDDDYRIPLLTTLATIIIFGIGITFIIFIAYQGMED